ncbi:MAG: adenylate/guanylate cyclase domain-containing protein [Alphaproteobacteria bacterium]
MTERPQRRLAAIVAADVAGYSRLVGVNEEATVAALRAHRDELIDPLLAKHGGRVANTAGDSLLLEFPSAVDALRCAIAMQAGMGERNRDVEPLRRIEFRVGINVGDVITEGADLLGNGVNVAARLEGLAEAGGIVLSRAARDQVRDQVDLQLEDLGEVEVKNIARPVRAFRYAPDSVGDRNTRNSKRTRSPSRLVMAAGMALLVCVAGVAAWLVLPWSTTADAALPPGLEDTRLSTRITMPCWPAPTPTWDRSRKPSRQLRLCSRCSLVSA